MIYFDLFNPFPHDKILDQTKLKTFADDKLNVTKMIISVFDRVENIVGKGEIACTSNFSFSHDVFKWLLSQRRQKVSLCGNGLNVLNLAFLGRVTKNFPQDKSPFLQGTIFIKVDFFSYSPQLKVLHDIKKKKVKFELCIVELQSHKFYHFLR